MSMAPPGAMDASYQIESRGVVSSLSDPSWSEQMRDLRWSLVLTITSNVAVMRDRSEHLRTRLPEAGVRFLDPFLAAAFERSQQIVPFETGDLAGTGWYEPVLAGEGSSVSMGYGPLPYAVIQHEALHFRHAAGRQAKYLEEPVMEALQVAGQVMADEMAARFRGIMGG